MSNPLAMKRSRAMAAASRTSRGSGWQRGRKLPDNQLSHAHEGMNMHDESHKKFRHPWQRLPPGQGKEGATESARSYQGFQIYFQMDPRERSLRKVAEQLGKSETWIETLSSKFHWRQRTEARDHYQAEIKAAAREKIERDSAAKWALREEQLRELKYEVSQEMITHGRKAIGQPQVRKELRKELGKETEAGCLKQVTASVPSQEGRHLIADGFALIEEAIRSSLLIAGTLS